MVLNRYVQFLDRTGSDQHLQSPILDLIGTVSGTLLVNMVL